MLTGMKSGTRRIRRSLRCRKDCVSLKSVYASYLSSSVICTEIDSNSIMHLLGSQCGKARAALISVAVHDEHLESVLKVSVTCVRV